MDGMPFREIEFACFKLILKPLHFVSRDSMFSFGKVIKVASSRSGAGFKQGGFKNVPIKIREVLFVDTPDFRFYNNAFILRRRIAYADGFPVTDPEFVFKFRHTDIQKAAEVDVRPQIDGDYQIKFKCQVLPLKDKLGGFRMLYSHNVQFPRSHLSKTDVFTMDAITRVFPVLKSLRKNPEEKIKLVNDTIIEEVLQDIGKLNFGQGISAKANISIWRTRGEHRPLIAEFSYRFKFNTRDEMQQEAMKRLEVFFIELQYAAKDWISLDATKTGIVYRLLGNKPASYE
jgi:hypothetical protein